MKHKIWEAVSMRLWEPVRYVCIEILGIKDEATAHRLQNSPFMYGYLRYHEEPVSNLEPQGRDMYGYDMYSDAGPRAGRACWHAVWSPEMQALAEGIFEP